MIRAAIFDLGGVVYHTDWDEADRVWSARLGLAEHGFLTAMFGGNDHGPLIGAVSVERWWADVAPKLKTDADGVRAIREWLDERMTIDHAMAGFIRSLRSTMITAYLSNAWSDTRDWLRRDGLEDVVDHVLLSCELGLAKPDPRIFRLALERVGVVPGEAIFVDDSLDNVDAARAVGLETIHHVDLQATVEALRSLLRPVTG